MIKNKSNILVSVIIPTYNRTNYVEDAILSVVNQTYKNIEIIIADDNAMIPQVREYIKKMVSKYPQCKLILNEENLGGSLNRNIGIRNSSGELISFLDDDDTYEPTRIEKVVDLYITNQDNNIGIIYTWCYNCDSELQINGFYKTRLTENPLFQHMGTCLCATSQWTIPKSVFECVGMFEVTPNKQDSIMLLKILGFGYNVLCVEECLSRFRNHDNGRISSSFEKHIQGETNYYNWCKKYFDKLTSKQVDEVKKRFDLQFLYNYSGIGNKKQVFKYYIKALKHGGLCVDNMKSLKYVLFSPHQILFFKKIIKRMLLMN